jgi:hypothetical protein
MPIITRRMRLAGQLIFMTAIAVPAHAQSSVAGSIAIIAQVVTPLALVVSHSLDFGRLLTSTTKTIAPSAATSGHFELIGQGGSAVTVTLSMPSMLNPTAGTNMPITGWTYVVSDSPALAGTPVSFNSGTSAPIPLAFQAFAGSTKMYFGIGATVTASATQPTTPYTGTGQITAAYTDL